MKQSCRSTLGAVLMSTVVIVALLPAGARAQLPVPASTVGASGAGDPYFPLQGNGGYDVRHYDLGISYTPRSRRIVGHEKITAVTTQRLSRFDLDLRSAMKVSSVTVDGRRAQFTRPAHELRITAPALLPAKKTITIRIAYHGIGRAIKDPDGSLDGWIPTDDGAFVASEPQGSPSWFAVNDTPVDKATYAVTASVPAGLAAISNGRLLGHRVQGGRSIWRWQIGTPISSYLVTATIGRFAIHRGRTPGGVPYLIAVDPTEARDARLTLQQLPKIVAFYSTKYGAYPFGQAGAIIDNAPNVGYALETATRPLFAAAPDSLTLAHELAHQWFGDTVTLQRWRDIWINEGFAEFSSWLWDQHSGGTTLRAHLANLRRQPAKSSVWNPPPGNPGKASEIFANSVYERGAGALEALREKLGDDALFYSILRGWLNTHRGGNGTTAGFTSYASARAHQDLTPFFQRWLYRAGKP